MYREKIVNIDTGEEIWRDYDAEEILAVEKAQAEIAARIAQQTKNNLARKILFEKLGITEEEAELLLG